MRFIALLLSTFLFINSAHCTIIELSPQETRFAAMRANKVNARSGPNIRYPIEWIYQQQYHPVEIIAEYDQWRKIKDFEGTISWVRKNLLTNARYVIITEVGENNIYSKESLNSDVIARAENGVIAKINRCTLNFCNLEFENNIKGWMPKNSIFGVKSNEEIK
jgi:SH3-like domain-containing protein